MGRQKVYLTYSLDFEHKDSYHSKAHFLLEGKVLKNPYLHINHAAVVRAQLAHEQLNREGEFGVIRGLRPLASDFVHGSHQERPWRETNTNRVVKVRAQSVPGANPNDTVVIETSKKVHRLTMRRRDRRVKQLMQENCLREVHEEDSSEYDE